MENLKNAFVNKAVGEPREYDMWKDTVWKSDPNISDDNSGWVELKNTTPIKSEWITAKNNPRIIPWSLPLPDHKPCPEIEPIPPSSPDKLVSTPSTSYPYQSTPPSSPGPSTSPELKWKFDDLDSSPRTSTPFIGPVESPKKKKDQYDSFKSHLGESSTKHIIRGTDADEDKTIISGHINMKSMDPFSYTFEEYYMPKINVCFLNLLLNGPAHLMCQEHYDPNNPNAFVSNCDCLPVCNCRAAITKNRCLPIGYKYNSDGHVVPSAPALSPRASLLDPTCISTG